MREELVSLLPISFVHVGSVSVFTILYGLFRVLNIGSVGVVTICGLAVLAWKPAPMEYS